MRRDGHVIQGQLEETGARNPRLGARSVQMHHSTTCLVSQKAGVWESHKIQKVPCHGDLLGAVKSITFIMEILDNF